MRDARCGRSRRRPQVWQTGYGRALLAKTRAPGRPGRTRLSQPPRTSPRFASVRRRGVVEIGLLAALLARRLAPDRPAAGEHARSAPRPHLPGALPAGRSACALGRGGAARALARVRGPKHGRPAPAGGAPRPPRWSPARAAAQATLRRAPDGTYAGLLPALPAGPHRARDRRRRPHFGATVTLGAPSRAPPVVAAPAPTGPVAAGEAADLAVGAQRSGAHDRARHAAVADRRRGARRARARGRARGDAVPGRARRLLPGARAGDRATVTVVGAPARPCAQVTAHLQMPAADARPAAGLLRRAASGVPGAAQPAGAERARLGAGPVGDDHLHAAGARSARDRRPRRRARPHHRHDAAGTCRRTAPGGGRRLRRCASPTRSGRRPPRPSTSPGTGGQLIQITLVQPGGPTFFRLWIDRRTHVVVRLRMITTAHFMSERELDLNHAPPVVPPP